MGRAPCCDKSKVTKGPWTPAEDIKLISFVQTHGHPNWRSLPKQAGLLRCGKSCRLRWMNYLSPDVKRGNWTPQEEDKIISLHRSLGNKWSKIAAKLPGRTDNEIKNVWNTHLKKKLKDLDHHHTITTNDRDDENDIIHKITSTSTSTSPSESKESPHSPSSTTSISSCSISYGDIFNHDDQNDTTNTNLYQNDTTLDVDMFWNTVLFTTASNSNDADYNILTKPWQLDLDYSQSSTTPTPTTGTKCNEDGGGGYEEWLRYLEDELGLVEADQNHVQTTDDLLSM